MTTIPAWQVSRANTGWSAASTPQTVAGISVQSGDVVVIEASTSDSNETLATPTGGGLTWTLQKSSTVASTCAMYVWTAVAASTQTFTASISIATGSGDIWGFEVSVWRGSDGVGASAITTGSGAPSLAITTSYADSVLVVHSGDWNAGSGASRTWRQVNSANPVEQAYVLAISYMTAYAAYHADTGVAGAKTVGLSAPTGQVYTTAAVEIRGTTAVTTAAGVEIEFTTGVWTDVTADVAATAVTIKYGRTSEFSAPSVATMTGMVLKNPKGNYSPLCQVLTDGTPAPHYPNVVPRKRIRYVDAVAGMRFTGYIEGWPPVIDANGWASVPIIANDRNDQLSRVLLLSPIAQEQATSAPTVSWPLTDAAGATFALENKRQSVQMLTGAGTALVFGDVGPGVGDGTGVKFAPSSSSAGQYLQAQIPLTLGAFTIEVYVNAGTVLPTWATSGTETIMGLDDYSGGFAGIIFLAAGCPSYEDQTGSTINAAASITDGLWHHIAVSRTAVSSPVTLFVDGVSQGATATSTASTTVKQVSLGECVFTVGLTWSPERFQGKAGYPAIYTRAMPPAEIASHAAARNGYAGDRTDQRIARWLTAAGLTAADWSLDVGKCVVGSYPQSGKSIVAACQDMATSEGGGSAYYVDPMGFVRFTNRWDRTPGAPVMTLDAKVDIDASGYQPSFDELLLVNSVTVTRSDETGTLTTQTAQDPVSSAPPPTGYGLSSGAVDTFTVSDVDALALGQSEVAAQANPGFRLPQVVVNLFAAPSTTVAALANMRIGSRIRDINLPISMGPATQFDVIAEGWTEIIGPDSNQHMITFDTSPADNPARGVYDDVVYGRYQCSGQSLNASLTNSATTVVIATAGTLPTFTVVAGAYPLQIQVGAEVMTLTSAPGGSTSPQTFTGVTRGVAGTTASAQASAAVVNLWPAATYTL